MNTPVKGNSPAGFAGDGGARLINRLPALACFALSAALHLAALAAFDFSSDQERVFTEPAELLLTLNFPDNAPEEAAAMPAASPQTAPLAAPQPAPMKAPEEPLPAALPQELFSEAAHPEEAPVEAAAGPVAAFPPAFAGGGGVYGGNAAQAGKAPMTEAEYLALIMGRLEKNKIYPQSVRKRGIEGDIVAAFTIRQDGTVSDMRLADPSGHRFLAQAAFETIRSASPFPVMEGHKGEYPVQVRIRYHLED